VTVESMPQGRYGKIGVKETHDSRRSGGEPALWRERRDRESFFPGFPGRRDEGVRRDRSRGNAARGRKTEAGPVAGARAAVSGGQRRSAACPHGPRLPRTGFLPGAIAVERPAASDSEMKKTEARQPHRDGPPLRQARLPLCLRRPGPPPRPLSGADSRRQDHHGPHPGRLGAAGRQWVENYQQAAALPEELSQQSRDRLKQARQQVAAAKPAARRTQAKAAKPKPPRTSS